VGVGLEGVGTGWEWLAFARLAKVLLRNCVGTLGSVFLPRLDCTSRERLGHVWPGRGGWVGQERVQDTAGGVSASGSSGSLSLSLSFLLP
jgi:hypothetical protein